MKTNPSRRFILQLLLWLFLGEVSGSVLVINNESYWFSSTILFPKVEDGGGVWVDGTPVANGVLVQLFGESSCWPVKYVSRGNDSGGAGLGGGGVEDLLIMVEYSSDCPLKQKVSAAEQSGASALLVIVNNVNGALVRAPIDCGASSIPILEVSSTDWRNFLRLEQKISVNVTSDHNVWLDIYDSPPFIFYQTLLSLLYFGLIVYLIYNGYYFIQVFGWTLSTTSVTLSLEFCGIVGIFISSLDLASSRGFLGDVASVFLIQFYTQIAVLTNLMMAFAFLEIFRKNKFKTAASIFLRKFRNTIIAVAVASIVVRLILISLKQFYVLSQRQEAFIGGTILTIQIALSLGLLLTVIIRVNLFYYTKTNPEHLSQLISIVNRFVILCTVFTLIFFVVLLWLVSSPFIPSNPAGYILINSITFLLGFISVLKIKRISHNITGGGVGGGRGGRAVGRSGSGYSSESATTAAASGQVRLENRGDTFDVDYSVEFDGIGEKSGYDN